MVLQFTLHIAFLLRKNTVISFFFLCLIASSFQQENWTIFNNSITINSLKSGLTDEQRDDYFYWVGLRNSFYYYDDPDQLEKLAHYFTPENDDYYSNLFSFSAPGFICAGAVFIVLIVYLVKRFLMNGCKGPKIIIKSYHYITYFFLITGFLIGIICLSITIHNSRISNTNINDMIDYVDGQKELMQNIFDETMKLKDRLEASVETTKYFNSSLYGEALIRSDHERLVNKYQSFVDDVDSIQKHKFRFQVCSLVLFLLVSAIGLAGFWIRREYIPWIASIILLLLAAPVFIMAGLETTYTFLSIDFCSNIGSSIISGITPTEDKGLGTYLSCPSKDTMKTISTAIYQYIVDFDYLFNQTDVLINGTTELDNSEYYLGLDKRNNTHFELLSEKISKSEAEKNTTEILVKNLEVLGYMNVLLAGLLSMTSCYTAKNSINYIEEKYCYVNHGYMFRNVIFDMLSAIGFIVIAVGLNKLMIVMRSHYSRSLRGKKEFNTDIIDDDDD